MIATRSELAMNVKTMSAFKVPVQRIAGLLITSAIFALLPMLTLWLPHGRFTVGIIGVLSCLNLAAMLYLNVSAPSDIWRFVQIVFAIASLVMFVLASHDMIGVNWEWN
jgi:hypothetical protein